MQWLESSNQNVISLTKVIQDVIAGMPTKINCTKRVIDSPSSMTVRNFPRDFKEMEKAIIE